MAKRRRAGLQRTGHDGKRGRIGEQLDERARESLEVGPVLGSRSHSRVTAERSQPSFEGYVDRALGMAKLV